MSQTVEPKLDLRKSWKKTEISGIICHILTFTFPQILHYCFIIAILFGFEQNVTSPNAKI